MGTCHIPGLLFLSLLGAFSLSLAQPLYCNKGKTMYVDRNSITAFNWTTEKVDTCDNGTFCQETLLVFQAGTETAILASKGCTTGDMEMITFVQHTPPPGLVAVSYSSYCQDSLCNDKNMISLFWKSEMTSGSIVSPTLYCPTCVALGTCLRAPSLPCPNGTTRCYEGKLQITGEDIDSVVEIKGCTATIGCRLMTGILTIGPLTVTETCQYQPVVQPRRVENEAVWLPISLWRLELLLLLLLLLLLQPLVHCS
ncbi:testis-expressed protein 101 [Dasypus novemcinctus]|uniref:testis-expressed protein 101 n=1 Tax=Dasypus novemcinctus TaxID=9361 RepID=UPI000C8435B1|nr:testis-expressed protein 101 [Dasypus novemcinctus]